MLFEADVCWAQDVSAVKPELKKEGSLLRDELHGLQMTVPIDS